MSNPDGKRQALRAPRDVLILTATVTPPHGATQLSRVDAALRLRDYSDALDFYLSCLKVGLLAGIVFADNSASDVSVLHDLVHDRGAGEKAEILSFDGLDYPPSHGRGYGEFKLIDTVVDRSRILREMPEDAPVWKVTGRYILRNFEAILRSRPRKADLYCHCRNIPMRWIDLYVLSWNARGYEQVLKGIYRHLKEDEIGGSAEQAFRRIVDESDGKARIVRRFRTLPRLEGYRGLDNRRYEEMGVKFLLRRIANTVAPWLWV